MFFKLFSSLLSLPFLLFDAKRIHFLDEQSLVEEISNRAEEQSSSKDTSNLRIAGHILKVHKGKLGLTQSCSDLLFTLTAHIFAQVFDVVGHHLLGGSKFDWPLGFLRDLASPHKFLPINVEQFFVGLVLEVNGVVFKLEQLFQLVLLYLICTL